MQHRRRTRNHDENLRLRCESSGVNRNGVACLGAPRRNETHHRCSVSAVTLVGRILACNVTWAPLDRLVLRIVYDTANIAEHGCSGRRSEKQSQAGNQRNRRETTKCPAPLRLL